ncbi:hypothetical protein DQ384_19890 [Sphaerisporangium album]|uniref:Uncharacterized protein n=1 Tax=Sphaerisporangium album TaxID=509200 RepID=A0A367FHL9_9ACTN|nr:hypothetical protein [Sphaerisporangium album]RCG29332.1 hypothetical protein DQ384_19890 [Sphaerisporangium album]
MSGTPDGDRRPQAWHEPGEVHEGLYDLVRAVERYRRLARRRAAVVNAIRRVLRGGRHGLGDLARGGASLVARRWGALRRRLRR